MTYLEKFVRDNPEFQGREEDIFLRLCPLGEKPFAMDIPCPRDMNYTGSGDDAMRDCTACWSREIPEAKKEKRRLKMFKTSCENPKVKYLCLFGRRYIFEEGKYVGWYKPGKKSK